MSADLKRAAGEAFAHATGREKQLLRDYPDAWRLLDTMRANPPMPWPDWCLLPMGAATAVAMSRPASLRPTTIALMSALYAWRFSRSVWLVEPALTSRLLTQVPDTLLMVRDAGEVIAEQAGRISQGRTLVRRGLAGARQTVVTLEARGELAPRGAFSEAGLARVLGVDRMTIRGWLGKR